MTDYPTSKRLCSLYRKKSKAGTTYFSGKLNDGKTAAAGDRDFRRQVDDEIPF